MESLMRLSEKIMNAKNKSLYNDFVLLKDSSNRLYLYCVVNNLMVSLDQTVYCGVRKTYPLFSSSISRNFINGKPYNSYFVSENHVKGLLNLLKKYDLAAAFPEYAGSEFAFVNCCAADACWFVSDNLGRVVSVYDSAADIFLPLDSESIGDRAVFELRTYYLTIVNKYPTISEAFSNLGFRMSALSLPLAADKNAAASEEKELSESEKPSKTVKSNGNPQIVPQIQELLDCDKNRCGLPSYEKEILSDIKRGHWDVFENRALYEDAEMQLIGRDPKDDIKKNGVIGIDFGTKSTVVVSQEGRNEIRPLRVGSLELSVEVRENEFENPTIISCLDLNSFLKEYLRKEGRPATSCNDFFVSYNAYEEYNNCNTDNFYAYYSDIKQWANSEKIGALVQDVRNKARFDLRERCSLEEKCINPIELYAYYIGMYINNMRNGVYMNYIMSFPVKYSKETKELIRRSFEAGLKKSLPQSVIDDEDLMRSFSVKYLISEPAAYAVTALESSGFRPQNETEKILYGVFDFGGGTTDFDFGLWRGASDEEYDKYNCDYVLECFGAESDVHLGGENILEMLAYQVFKENKKMAAEKHITCALPVDQIAFIGGEKLISNSQSAHRNLTILKEAFRPLWEQHENWESNYQTDDGDQQGGRQYLEIQMYDVNSEPVPNCRFVIDTKQLLELIKARIKKGVDAFFKCIEKAVLKNAKAQDASEKVHIFLAGNSCRSKFVTELFEAAIKEHEDEYRKIAKERNCGSGAKDSERFELIAPLSGGNGSSDSQYVPNAKTSVAYGLVKSRPGSKILVVKNSETDSEQETRFKYYLGTERRGVFVCKLSPFRQDDGGASVPSYNVWHKFQGAGSGIGRIYYTENPAADSKAVRLDINDIPFHEVVFEADENKYLFVRAVRPSVIEYAAAASEEEIGRGDIRELDIAK